MLTDNDLDDLVHLAENKDSKATTIQNNELLSLLNYLTAAKEVTHWAQAILTALNVGDIKRESLLHLKLRAVMIEYREKISQDVS